MDFSVIIPRMREEITKYIDKRRAQGKELTQREGIIKWLDLYYEDWIGKQLGIEKDSDKADENRRRARRIPIELSAYYRVLWSPEVGIVESDPISESGEVKNISSGGLYIVTGRSYPISTLLELQFELPTIPDSISAFAMVVWSHNHGKGRHGLGLHFSHIETTDSDALNEAIMEKLLDAPVIVVDK